MSKQIHKNDIDEQKQVFEVTLPINQLEKLQICVGNAYESSSSTNKYNIYNVDKGSKKVTENIGYYELPKDESNVLDKEGDFNVRELGEEKMFIYEEFKSRYGKGKSKPAKKAKAKKVSDDEESDEPDKKYALDDQQKYMQDYFDGNYKLDKAKIVPTYLENLAKSENWANDVAISLTGMFSKVYIIIANEQVLYTEVGEEIKDAEADTPLLDLNMFIYPSIDQLPYDKSNEYVIVSYKSQTHYRLVQHKGKVRFKESELPNVITDRFCKRHHDGAAKGVEDDSFDTEVIETITNGDCFFDSIYRATRADDPSKKPNTAYAKEVEAFRKEIAKDMAGNPIAQKIITQIYIRQTEESYDSIKEEFFKKKNGSSKKESIDDNIFQFAVATIFGKEHNEDDFTFEEKRDVLTKFLTLFYEFVSDITEDNKDEFRNNYRSIYGLGLDDIKGDSVDAQREKLKPLFNEVKEKSDAEPKPAPKPEPKPEPKPAPKPDNEEKEKPKKQKKPKIVIAPSDEPDVEVEKVDAPKPASDADKSEKKPIINIPEGTDPKVIDIIGIFLSSNTDKKAQFDKFSKNQLVDAWEIIYNSDKTKFQAKSTVSKNKEMIVNCLLGNTPEICLKQSKKVSGGKSSKYTRKK